jgi:hypothetical protein
MYSPIPNSALPSNADRLGRYYPLCEIEGEDGEHVSASGSLWILVERYLKEMDLAKKGKKAAMDEHLALQQAKKDTAEKTATDRDRAMDRDFHRDQKFTKKLLESGKILKTGPTVSEYTT